VTQRIAARTFALPLLTALVVTAACGGDDNDSPPAGAAPPMAVVAGEPFPEERCAANREAGTITFLTGFDFAAAASIVEVITADSLGFYEELCLDVEILSSFSTANYPLVAGGQGQFASGGSVSEVVAFSLASETDLVVVTVAGRTPIDTLLVKPGVAETPADLAGTTIGVKGKLPASVEVMLLGAGLTEGEHYDTVLVDGFDPVAHLAIPSISAVPGWKSNEPGRLEREGVEFTAFDPSAAEVPGSFGAIFTSREFFDRYPTAAEDFVRATLRGLAAAIDDPEMASAAAVALVEAGGNPNFLSIEGEVFRWGVEAELIASTTPTGVAPGTPDLTGLGAEMAAYSDVGFFGERDVPAAADHVDADLAARVTSADGSITWPG
jgi:ABC-type nitrate/sulfonate/bicarbonate transport system substrate-binding protein